MYAVFQNGGKQYRVNKEQVIRLEKLDVSIGGTIKFTRVLMIVDNEKIKIGSPIINGGIVIAEVINHGRSKKIKIVKFRRRKHYRKQQGHRQWFTDVKVKEINII